MAIQRSWFCLAAPSALLGGNLCSAPATPVEVLRLPDRKAGSLPLLATASLKNWSDWHQRHAYLLLNASGAPWQLLAQEGNAPMRVVVADGKGAVQRVSIAAGQGASLSFLNPPKVEPRRAVFYLVDAKGLCQAKVEYLCHPPSRPGATCRREAFLLEMDDSLFEGTDLVEHDEDKGMVIIRAAGY